jgi:hypothetical protein
MCRQNTLVGKLHPQTGPLWHFKKWFVVGPLYDAFKIFTQYSMNGTKNVNDELEALGRKRLNLIEVLSRYPPAGTENFRENFSQDNPCPCRDKNQAPLGRHRNVIRLGKFKESRWKNRSNCKTDIREVHWEDVNWIILAHDRAHWWVVGNGSEFLGCAATDATLDDREDEKIILKWAIFTVCFLLYIMICGIPAVNTTIKINQ